MNHYYKTFVYLIILLFAVSCTVGKKGGPDGAFYSPGKPYTDYRNKKLKIPVVENIRELPNGEVIGESRKGEAFVIRERRGNWFRIQNPDFPDGYIWAPSFGIPKINLLSLSTWYDLENELFFSPDQYENLLGGPSETTEHFGLKRNNYFDIGLGREVETEMDQLGRSREIVHKKGAAIIFSKEGGISEIIVDLKHPLNGFKNFGEKIGIDLGAPDSEDESRVVWKNRFGLKEISLFREEYKSNRFNQIALIK